MGCWTRAWLHFGVCVCAVLLGVSGCRARRPAVLFGPSTPLVAADYDAVLRTWTRSEKIYQGLENKLFITATYHSPELRRAVAVAFPDIYGHGGKITRRELVDLTGDVEQFHNFFVAMFTPDTKWNDLNKTDSIWRLVLSTSNGIATQPGQISQIKVDENLRAVYPYLSRFDRAYLVRFPLTDAMGRVLLKPDSTWFTLRISSALGAAELTWRITSSA